MANTLALGASAQKACGFKSRLPHQIHGSAGQVWVPRCARDFACGPTPAKRLKFKSRLPHQIHGSAGQVRVPRCARDFACGLTPAKRLKFKSRLPHHQSKLLFRAGALRGGLINTGRDPRAAPVTSHGTRAYDSYRRAMLMHSLFRRCAPLLLAVAMALPVAMMGCRSQETVYYEQWEHDTHREHMDLNKRSAEEQREYADWRRSQDERH